MEKTIKDYEDYEGIDADLETSLYEYGLIWKQITPEGELLPTHYHFVYGVGLHKTESGEMEYNQFDWGDIPVDCDPRKEWNWVKWEKVAETSGMSKEEFLDMPLPLIVSDLISYYGHENVFGSSYYPFPIYKEIYVECGSCGQYHRESYHGDCREDSERFNFEDIPEGNLIVYIEEGEN